MRTAWMATLRTILFVLAMFQAALILGSCDMSTAEEKKMNQSWLQPGRNCTWFVAPSGRRSNSGKELTSPFTLREAAKRARPGDTVCLLAGRYDLDAPIYISKGGTADAYITYTSYDASEPALLNWIGSAAKDMFQVNNNAAYIRVQGLKFNGNNVALAGIKCSTGSHHIIVSRNTITNAGSAGIASVRCDYLTIDGNKIHHTGYGKGNSSGISLNQSIWFDRATGFHSFVVNNIVAGSFDQRSRSPGDSGVEGNGITMDREGDTPPVLIANNLIYMNAARCIIINRTNNKWVINNTCYANSLDPYVGSGTGSTGELMTNNAANVYFINNAVVAWNKGYPVEQIDSRAVNYDHNTYYGGKALKGVPSSVEKSPAQLRKVDPLFVDPFPLDRRADEQYRVAPHPDQVGNRYQLQASSPLIDAGIDPRNVAGMTAELRAGIEQYVLTDIDGARRPQGNGFDIGAYEYSHPTTGK
jgi:hypothetical protein